MNLEHILEILSVPSANNGDVSKRMTDFTLRMSMLLDTAGRESNECLDPVVGGRLARWHRYQKAVEMGLDDITVSFFANIVRALGSGTAVNLREYGEELRFVETMCHELKLSADLSRELIRLEDVKPVPFLHWRVDRPQYDDRFHFPHTEYLQTFVKADAVLLEEGGGNGQAMRKRRPAVTGYRNFMLCDTMYYSISTLLEKLIDFHALAESVNFAWNDRSALCDTLYKILVIEEGGLDQANIPYDAEFMAALQRDPSSIIDALHRKIHLLPRTATVPDSTGIPNGRGGVLHPKSISCPTSASYRAGCEELARDLDRYVFVGRDKANVYSFLPVHPQGTIIGDFRQIGSLKERSLDAVLGVRSTSYLEGQEYIDYKCTMAGLLTEDGDCVSDDLRRNHGSSYKIGELLEVERRIGFPLYVILGPGQPLEDLQKIVPAAVVMTRNVDKLNWICQHLAPIATMVPLQEVAMNDEYLLSLDRYGRTHASVKQYT